MKKENIFLVVFIVMIGILAVIIFLTSNNNSDVSAPATQASSVDCAVLDQHAGLASNHISDAIDAIGALNLDGAERDIRLAASEIRSMGDAAAGETDVITHYHRAADALEQAADYLGARKIDTSSSYMSQGINEMKQGTEALGSDCPTQGGTGL